MDSESGEFWTGIWHWVAVPPGTCHRISVGLSFLMCNMEPWAFWGPLKGPLHIPLASFPASQSLPAKPLSSLSSRVLHLYPFSPLPSLFLVLWGSGGLQVRFGVYPLLDSNGELSKPQLIRDQAEFYEQGFALLWLGRLLHDITGWGEAKNCQNMPAHDIERNWEERGHISHLFPFLICVFIYFLVRGTVPMALSLREAQRFSSHFSSRSSNLSPNCRQCWVNSQETVFLLSSVLLDYTFFPLCFTKTRPP